MKILRAVLFLSLALLTVNCGKVRFTPTKSAQAAPPVSGDTSDIAKVTCGQDSFIVPTKVLFVVDQSGSNRYAFRGNPDGSCGSRPHCVPSTDPDKSFRSGSIADFFTRYQGKKNLSWGLESFSGSKAQSLLWVNGTNKYFGSAIDMQAAIIKFKAKADFDSTPYLAALSMAYKAIVSDPGFANGPFAAKYYIVFMSDGYATDDRTKEKTYIKQAVQDLINIAPSRISLSTVYYARQYDAYSASILRGMASIGKGQFVNVDVNTMKKISIQDLISLPTMSCR